MPTSADFSTASERSALLGESSDFSLPLSEIDDVEEIEEKSTNAIKPHTKTAIIGVACALIIVLAVYLWNSHVLSLSSSAQPLSSRLDSRRYEAFRLPNQLSVIIVQDENAPLAAAALSVNVGYYSDPLEIPGLAHLCEHMRFMGSEKFPSEVEYFSFILGHGGSANAFTKEEETNFHFQVESSALPGALDRFAQFFVSPLFADGAVGREIHAVDSEHSKNILNDERRHYAVLERVATPLSALHRFPTGDLQTLNHTDLRARLVQFSEKNYAARRMKLVIQGSLPLADLKNLAIQYFSPIDDFPVYEPEFPSLPFISKKHDPLPKLAIFRPVENSHRLSLLWQVQPLEPEYQWNAVGQVNNLLAQRSTGSLHARLHALGWIESIRCGSIADTKTFSLYEVSILLTDSGVSHLHGIIGSLFEEFRLIDSSGVTLESFEELRRLDAIEFDYFPTENPMSRASEIASAMQSRQIPDVLGSPERRIFDKKHVKNFLAQLKPDSMVVMLASSAVPENSLPLHEPYYGIDYDWRGIPKKLVDEWFQIRAGKWNPSVDPNAPAAQPVLDSLEFPFSAADTFRPLVLEMPHANPFVPEEFSLLPPDSVYSSADDDNDEISHDFPLLLRENNSTRIYYRQDFLFQRPLSSVFIDFKSHLLHDPSTQAIALLYVEMVKDSFASSGFFATAAHFQWSIIPTPCSIRVSISGFSDRILLVAEKLRVHLLEPRILASQFDAVRGALLARLHNELVDYQPWQYARYLTALLLEKHKYANQRLAAMVDQLISEEVEQFIPRFFSETFVQVYGYGNLASDSLLKITDDLLGSIASRFPSSPVTKDAVAQLATISSRHSLVLLPPAQYFFQHRTFSPGDSNSAVYVTIFRGEEQTPAELAALELFHFLVRPLCFYTLRTVEQLGYVAQCTLSSHSPSIRSFDIVIQGTVANPVQMEFAIEGMIAGWNVTLADLEEEKIEAAKASLIALKLQAPLSMEEAAQRDWSQIIQLDFKFHRAQLEAEAIAQVDKPSLITFYERFIRKSVERTRIAVEIFSGTGEIPTAGNSHIGQQDFLTRENENPPESIGNSMEQSKISSIGGNVKTEIPSSSSSTEESSKNRHRPQ